MGELKENHALSYILQIAGSLFLGIGLTFGMFYYLDNPIIAGLLSIIALLIFTSIVQRLITFKTNPEYQSLMIKKEKVWLSVYLVFGMIFTIPFAHFINVKFNLNPTVKSNIKLIVEQMDNELVSYSKWIDSIRMDNVTNPILPVFDKKMNFELDRIKSELDCIKANVQGNFFFSSGIYMLSFQNYMEKKLPDFIDLISKSSNSHPLISDKDYKVRIDPDMPKLTFDAASKSLLTLWGILSLPLLLIFHFMVLFPYFYANRGGW